MSSADGRAHMPGTGSRRDARRRSPHTHTASRSAGTTSNRRHAEAPEPRWRGSSRPKTTDAGPLPRQVSDLRVVAVDHEHRVRAEPATTPRQRSATCSSSPYRSSWSRKRFPRQTARGRTRAAISGNAASSTSNRPSSASLAARSAEVTPERRFAPEALWASRARGERIRRPSPPWSFSRSSPRRRRFPAGAAPRAGRARPDRCVESTFPGTVVPPPAPTRRDSAPTARAAAIPSGRGTFTLTPPAYRPSHE